MFALCTICITHCRYNNSNLLFVKSNLSKKFIRYIYSHFAGNFLGFVIGMASTRLVSDFFTTRSIKNIWGLTTRKTVVDKQTFHFLEWMISILIGFFVFEIISKWVKQRANAMLPKYKLTRWMANDEEKAYAKNDDEGAV